MTYLNPNRNFPQKATYWAQVGQDGYSGDLVAAPIVISCRWETMSSEILSVAYKASGEEVIEDSFVYTPTPLEEGGYLYLGETTEADPTRFDKAYVIRSTSVVPSINGEIAEYTAKL